MQTKPQPNYSILITVCIALLSCTTSFAVGAAPDAAAEHLLERYGITKGVCSVLGDADPALPLELALQSDLYVHLQGSGDALVDAVRKSADSEGLYGKRIVAEVGSQSELPYVDNTIDLLVVQTTADGLGALSLSEIVRVLCPRGTVIVGNTEGKDGAALKKWLKSDGLSAPKTGGKDCGVWCSATKTPPEGTDDWSHWEHGPDNNPVSSDEVIKAPYMTQYLGGPYYIAMPAITTAAAGRVFIAMGHIAHHVREEKWLNTLVARNGYNGTELWSRKLPDGYLVHRSAFVATEEAFYMIDADGQGCVMLDPDTGYEIDRIRIPRIRGEWKWMAKDGDTLYLLAGTEKDPAETTLVRSQYSHWSWGELSKGYYAERVPWGFGTTVAAVNLKKKKLIWKHEENEPIDSRGMVLGGERLYLYGPDSHLRCLQAKDGEVVWTQDDPEIRELIEETGKGLGSTPGFRSNCFSLYTPDVLFYEAQTRQNIVAVSAEDGRKLWHRTKTTNNPNMLYVEGNLLVGIGPDGSTLEINPLTGDTIQDLGFKKRSCARLTATPDSFFCRGWPEGITRYDRNTKKIQFNGAMRPACNDGVLPANGLLYIGPWLCDCNLSVMGSAALCSTDEARWQKSAGLESRLQKFASGSTVEPLKVQASDWPTYRGNNDRSASTSAKVAESGLHIWSYVPKTPFMPTAPVSAGGLVFIGGDDGILRAIDGSTGLLKWSYATAGSILHAPTVWNSRVFIGSGDGYIYSLEAATGRLLWRFRAAPAERRMMVYGSLCSTWPVNTGVLIEDGVAYAAAGLVDYDGTYVYALDAETGELKWMNDSTGHLDKELRKGVSAQGTLTIANGCLFMPGGNVVSPAIYRLSDGVYVGSDAFDGSPRSNRGEEIGVLSDGSILLGGRLRYSATENVVNPGFFQAIRVDASGKIGAQVPVGYGKIAPAWTDEQIITVNGPDTLPACYTAEALKRLIQAGQERSLHSAQWQARPLSGRDTISLAVASNAFLAVTKNPGNRALVDIWRLCALRPSDGSVMWQRIMNGPILPGGILVDRDGRVITATQEGRLDATGGVDALQTYVRSLNKAAADEPDQKDLAVRMMRDALRTSGDTASRDYLMQALLDMGHDVTAEAREAGCVTKWRLVGPVPWDPTDPKTDAKFLAEANLDSKSISLDGAAYHWNTFITDQASGMINLANLYGSDAGIAAYAYAEFDMPEAKAAVLSIGSNDGFRCWLNGTDVGGFDGGRSYSPDQTKLSVQCQKGRNRVLLKITQHGGAWAFSVRATTTSGQPIQVADK